MASSGTLSRRKMLQLLGGLGIGFLPLAGCFDQKKPSGKKPDNPTPDTNPATDTATAVEVPAVTEKDVLLLERSAQAYAKYNTSFNLRIPHLPKYIAVCFTTAGVQFALQKARQESLPVSIKSGGHSFEGFSSNDGGMVVNVSQMKGVLIENNTVRVGPGLLLRDLHREVYTKGHLVPAGSCAGVGIAGLTLGGGYGFFSRKYGLTCDNLMDATLVLANGRVVEAAKDAELLWALRGGGNGNFGVVTSLKFKTHPLPATFAATTIRHIIPDAAGFETMLRKWMEAAPQLPPEAFGAFVQNGKTLTLLFTNYANSNISSISRLFENGAKSVSHSTSAGKPFTDALKRYYGRSEPMYFKNASCGYYRSFEDISGITGAIFEQLISQSPNLMFQVNTLGGAIGDEDFAAGSCYPHRSFPFLSELQGYYYNPAHEAGVLERFASIQKLVSDKGITAQYRNYPDLHFADWQHAYYGNNYETLVGLKHRYDPENLFRYPQSIEVGSAV